MRYIANYYNLPGPPGPGGWRPEVLKIFGTYVRQFAEIYEWMKD